MASWENLDINLDSNLIEDIEDEFVDTTGLTISPKSLHSEFHVGAQHLKEVEMRHKQVLVTAGMIPEEHISTVEPDMSLKWMVEELNGRMNPDGLSIPLMGVDLGDFQILFNDDERHINVKLSIKDGQTESFERTFNIPKDSMKNEVSAHFINNRLYLRW
ncbi:MAG: hypothetical protein QF479_04160 [Candidatus Poseidoniaceae archaeon]|nr:hypothetical protein [Candidatus Poseidoniaceae archaeon]